MFKIISTCRGGGYRYCRTDPPHPKRNAKGLYPLHRVLMEIKLERLLESDEDVHHKDHNKENNDPSNLEVKTHADHTKEHNPQKAKIPLECPCGKIFYLKPSIARHRIRVSRYKPCCSRRCAGIYSKSS